MPFKELGSAKWGDQLETDNVLALSTIAHSI